MTAPTLVRTQRDRIRVRKADPVEQAELAFARKVEADLAAHLPTVVTVQDYGPGWYIVGVDRQRRLFEVRRSGEPISVSWSAVRAGK